MNGNIKDGSFGTVDRNLNNNYDSRNYNSNNVDSDNYIDFQKDEEMNSEDSNFYNKLPNNLLLKGEKARNSAEFHSANSNLSNNTYDNIKTENISSFKRNELRSNSVVKVITRGKSENEIEKENNITKIEAGCLSSRKSEGIMRLNSANKVNLPKIGSNINTDEVYSSNVINTNSYSSNKMENDINNVLNQNTITNKENKNYNNNSNNFLKKGSSDLSISNANKNSKADKLKRPSTKSQFGEVKDLLPSANEEINITKNVSKEYNRKLKSAERRMSEMELAFKKRIEELEVLVKSNNGNNTNIFNNLMTGNNSISNNYNYTTNTKSPMMTKLEGINEEVFLESPDKLNIKIMDSSKLLRNIDMTNKYSEKYMPKGVNSNTVNPRKDGKILKVNSEKKFA